MERQNIRNIAIIAHIDHGKTTLVDAMLKQSGIFRENEKVPERIMDTNELERERGITILAKNTSVRYRTAKINIVDTPGHADFGGEVERVLKMVNGVLLLVDAFEGPMPQTRFVLQKALSLNLSPLVVINKIDRLDTRIAEVEDEIIELFMELGADDRQLDFPVIYASARKGTATADYRKPGHDLAPLFDAILNHVPPPDGDTNGPLQLMVNNTSYDQYLGRMALGLVSRGMIEAGQTVTVIRPDNSSYPAHISRVYTFEGLERTEIANASCGEIVTFAGIADINIGDTVACKDNPEPLPSITVDEPTLKMSFSVNDSPFAGQEGSYLTSRELRGRLFKEAEKNVSLRVYETEETDVFTVCGRGELHLSILIETMRREGFEFQVSRPQVIYKTVDGQLFEPLESLLVDIPGDSLGPVMELVGIRRGEMTDMHNMSEGQIRLQFKIPARGLIGLKSRLLTETRGQAVLNHNFYGYEPFKGEIPSRRQGVLVAMETGEATLYGLHSIQDRGSLIITPATRVYEGMIVGISSREYEIPVNVCKKKHLTNVRSSTAQAAMRLEEPLSLSLEEAISFLSDDELLEVTPAQLRLRKKSKAKKK